MKQSRPPVGTGSYGERLCEDLSEISSDPQTLLRQSRVQANMMNPPNYQVDLDILSATTYPGGLLDISAKAPVSNRKRGSQQLYGGLLMRQKDSDESRFSSSPEALEDELRPKKRQRRSNKNNDDDALDKKQRGRPRLDTQDETAADRRRTQIRLAQRAYRHRKETTIVALKEQVSEMVKMVDSLDAVFRDYHDQVCNTGMLANDPVLALKLQNMSNRFDEIVRTSNAQDSDHEADMEVSKLQETDSQAQALDSLQSTQPANGGAAWGYSMSFEPVEDGEDINFMTTEGDSELVPAKNLVTGNWELDNSTQQYSVFDVPNGFFGDTGLPMEIERPLKTAQPYTYSFQETSFHRRLHRMCLEQGYRILTAPNIDPAYVNRRYKLTFCISNRRRMVQRFQEVLKRKAGEPLENYAMPFVGVGGAGKHFPRRDELGNAIYPPNIVTPAQFFGPLMPIQPETPRPHNEESYAQLLESLGFGGEWFDSHDVEEYLKTKGLFLDGSSSFVEMDPSLINLPALTESQSSTSSGSSPGSTVLTPPLPSEATDPGNINQATSSTTIDELLGYTSNLHGMPEPELKLKAYNSLGLALAQDNMMWFERDPAFVQSLSVPEPANTLRRMVTIDVQRFLQRIIENSSTCLGRAPGFRKEQVDIALALSLQEAF